MNLVRATVSSFFVYLFFILFSFSAVAQTQIAPPSTPNGFPSSNAGDGEVLVASQGLASLGAPSMDGQVFNVHIRVPIGTSELEISLFDPDLHSDRGASPAFWDFPTLNDPSLPPVVYEELVRFELYPDVDIEGNINSDELIASFLADVNSDNQWVDFFQGSPHPIDELDPAFDLACQTGVGAQFCFYHLVARWVEVDPPHDVKPNATTFPFPGQTTGNVLNGFIVASNGLPFLAAGSTIGIMGMTEDNPSFPVPPAEAPSTGYDGTISLRALIDDPNQCALDIYDGDSDRAGSIENPAYPDESDDPNTPNDGLATGFFPFVVSADALEENAIPGNPGDNSMAGTGISIGGPIAISVTPEPPTVPYGVPCCLNNNPSGNQEWELYRIAGSSNPNCPDPTVNPTAYDPDDRSGEPGGENGPAPAAAPDEVVTDLGVGFHNITLNGMDPNNLNFLNVSADVFAGDAFDFGDAPDSYSTSISAGGPQHDIDTRLVMGAEIDLEFDGLPSAAADSDDNAVSDDEDGVASFAVLNEDDTGTYTVDVVVRNELSVAATLNGWIDFNQNGVFDTPSEFATAAVAPGATSVALLFTIPADIGDGVTYARFRLSSDGASIGTPGGESIDGEVEDYTLTIDPGDDECIPCKGMKNITFKMSDWDDYGSFQRDPNETVRVRVGDLLGQFSGNDFNAPILFEGTVPNGGTIEITNIPEQYLGMPLTISVQSPGNHPTEWGKSRFYPDCDLELLTKSGGSYIEFKVIDFMKNSEEICECVECEIGPAKVTFKITNTGGRDEHETIRVRVGNLSGELSNPDDTANPVIFSGQVGNGETFMVEIPAEHRGKTLSITVQDEISPITHHPKEFVKAKFHADCDLKIGDFSSLNGYLKVKVHDLEGDTGEICPNECPPGSTAGHAKDYFSYKSYDNNNGDRDWSGPWEETDAGGNGPHGGYVKIKNGLLRMTKEGSKIMREVDVCASTDVWLKFKYKTSKKVDWDDRVAVEVSPDGGSNWHLVKEFSGKQSYWKTSSHDISEYASENTKVRFRVSNKYGGYGEWFYVTWIIVSSN